MTFERAVLAEADFPELVWTEFEKQCPKDHFTKRPKSNPSHTIGPVKELLNILATKSEPNWLLLLKKQGDQKHAFDLLNNLAGIGEKLAAFIVRDAYTINGLWASLPTGQEYTVQPLDVQVERWSNRCWSGLFDGIPTTDTISKMERVSQVCVEQETEPAAFNKGAWFVGSHFGRFLDMGSSNDVTLLALLDSLDIPKIVAAIGASPSRVGN
jgi:hypothetical protein